MGERGHRWSKFWWQDWSRDPALRMCGPGARGVWMDMLSIMFDAVPQGHLLVNGRRPTMKQLASVFGTSEREATGYVRELEESGVFSKTDDGTIFSRRMVRDKAASDIGRENGLNGGNPRLNGSATKKDKPSGNEGGLTPSNKTGPNLQEAEAEKKDPVSLRSTAPAEPSPPLDARTDLFRTGLDRLRGMTGQPEPKCRALIGRMLKDLGDDAAACLQILNEANDLRPADPTAWIVGAVMARKRQPAAKPSKFAAWDLIGEALGTG